MQQDSNAQHMSFYKRRIKKSKGNVLQHVLSKSNTNALQAVQNDEATQNFCIQLEAI